MLMAIFYYKEQISYSEELFHHKSIGTATSSGNTQGKEAAKDPQYLVGRSHCVVRALWLT